MKRLLIILLTAALCASCGVGAYSVASAKSDEAAVSFVSTQKTPVSVVVDGKTYEVETVMQKAFKKNPDIKATAANTIKLPCGQHDIEVYSGGTRIYGKKIILNAAEHRVIEL
ncbi:MAG: hypothetical protein MJY69_04490 [Bacteroidales bacterium]|nr:hypothetical protein [Bacteroidales bacterium]